MSSTRAVEPLPGYLGSEANGVLRPVSRRRRCVPGAARLARKAAAERREPHASSPETSTALGFGFRCGFLGLLHMEIIRERLEREFNLAIIATAPSVAYIAHLTDGRSESVSNPSELPPAQNIDHIDEPMLTITIITPAEYTGTIIDLCQSRRGQQEKMAYLSRRTPRAHLPRSPSPRSSLTSSTS